ncbi:hypothetical protein Tco_0841070 [Tanacetum coccineum]|uniref:Uncharacterized protein n=1 Tax=Tanacetum coccineum TaxID=301880 RepID=A0ABQ5AWQ5_9ASTR
MKRARKDFSGRITPLLDTMMVQATEEVGEDSDHQTDITQSSQPKKKQPSKKAQRQKAEVPQDEVDHEESVPTPSNDPQPSEDLGELERKKCQRPIVFEETQEVRFWIIVEMPMEAKLMGKEEITLAQRQIQINAAKPKLCTTGLQQQHHKPKDEGGGIMIEPEVPLKRKDQIALDEQIARDIQAKLDAELIEEQKLARKQEEEANIALIIMENTQAITEENSNVYYLKHMGGYTYKQLKGKSFDEIQKLFDKEMKRVNTFVAMGSEVQESKEKKEEGREETTKGSRKKMLGRKRVGKEQQQESSQKVEEEKESDTVDEYNEAELKMHCGWKFQEILFNDKNDTRNRQRRLGSSLEDSEGKSLRRKTPHSQLVGSEINSFSARALMKSPQLILRIDKERFDNHPISHAPYKVEIRFYMRSIWKVERCSSIRQ